MHLKARAVLTSQEEPLRGSARALLVIDDRVLAEVVKLALNHGNYQTRLAHTTADASAALTGWNPHLLVLDLDIDRDRILTRLEAGALQARLALVALTRRGDLKSRLAAFEHGVDDILTVPFSPEEFVARVLAIMRRTYRQASVFAPVLRLAGLEIDTLNRRVRAGGTELHLTAIEQGLLYLLAANAGRVLTRDEILDYVWGTDYVAESNIVDRHVGNLRLKLQNHSRHPPYIVTVARRGYLFVATQSELAAD